MNVKEFYQITNGNYEQALKIMMNDSFIERMLGKFISNNSYNEIISCYAKKDFQTLFAAVHTFKGVVGNLALTPLFEIASIITEATRSLEDVNIDQEIAQLKERYELVVNTYQKLS